MAAENPESFQPFVPANESPPEFTVAPLVVGSLLGVVFGASSMYLVLKVGLTVSASIPVSVLTFALFRILSKSLNSRNRSVLENNISQTAGSAGESIAFAVGLVMPALLVLGFDIDYIRVMTVGILGGLLGILMMIPLRRAFIVKKHGELKYPEGTACADVLIAGEKGGSTAGTLVIGLVLGFIYQFSIAGFNLLKDTAAIALSKVNAAGQVVGLKGATVASEMSAPLLGVGYIIGPRIASTMVAGGVLAYLVLTPMIVYFGEHIERPVAPAKSSVDPETGIEINLIKSMNEKKIRNEYILYIGAGCVAAGGIISMLRALPVIVSSAVGGFRDLTGSKSNAANAAAIPRTEQDLPIWIVLFGSLGLLVALAVAPSLGLGLNPRGFAGAAMILFFGFLFVTVSSRLTGEIGSSSNPISGMTVATLLLTCLILVGLSEFGIVTINKEVKLLALTVAGVVCVASSNGGTTSQALKTGHLLGATPKYQQYAILIGSLASAVAVGVVLLILNDAGTIYTKRDLPNATIRVDQLTTTDHVKRGEYSDDKTEYKVLILGKREKLSADLLSSGKPEDVAPGRYFIDETGRFKYRCDPAVNGSLKYEDGQMDKPESERVPVIFKFDAPKTELVALIIDGILERKLPWELVFIGVLIAITMELCGVPSLPFAVGVYLPLASSVPIFIGGALRWFVDLIRKNPNEEDTSPGVLLSSGYIAGGAIATLCVAGIEFLPSIKEKFDLAPKVLKENSPSSNLNVTIAFAALGIILVLFALLKDRKSSSA